MRLTQIRKISSAASSEQPTFIFDTPMHVMAGRALPHPPPKPQRLREAPSAPAKGISTDSNQQDTADVQPPSLPPKLPPKQPRGDSGDVAGSCADTRTDASSSMVRPPPRPAKKSEFVGSVGGGTVRGAPSAKAAGSGRPILLARAGPVSRGLTGGSAVGRQAPSARLAPPPGRGNTTGRLDVQSRSIAPPTNRSHDVVATAFSPPRPAHLPSEEVSRPLSSIIQPPSAEILSCETFEHATLFKLSHASGAADTCTKTIIAYDAPAVVQTSGDPLSPHLTVLVDQHPVVTTMHPLMGALSPRSRVYVFPCEPQQSSFSRFECLIVEFDKDLLSDKTMLILLDEMLLARRADVVLRGHHAVDQTSLRQQQGAEVVHPWRRGHAVRSVTPDGAIEPPPGFDLLSCTLDETIIVFELEERNDGWAICEVFCEKTKKWVRGALPAEAVRLDVKEQSENERMAAKTAHATATGVAATGRVVGKGIAGGARLLSRGLSRGTDEQLQRKRNSDTTDRTVDPTAAQAAKQSEESSSKFLQGSRKAMLGFQKGTSKLGHGVSNAVKSTDTYKERQERNKYNERSVGKAAAMEVGSAAVSAAGSVIHGVKDGAVITAEGVRDNRVRYIEETQGKQAAEAARARFNAAGQTATGTYNVLSIATNVTTGKWILHSGVAGAMGDPRRGAAIGGTWWPRKSDAINHGSTFGACAPARLQDWAVGTCWHRRYISLRPMALVFFDKDVSGNLADPGPIPDGIVTLETILLVEFPFVPSPPIKNDAEGLSYVSLKTRERRFVFALDSNQARELASAVIVLKAILKSKGYA